MQVTYTPDFFNQQGNEALPGLLGVEITLIADRQAHGEFQINPQVMALNGYLHAGSLVTLADTCCGYGCLANMPENALSFTTIELKSNHLGTAREGIVDCVATAAHLGRSTQIWDAILTHRDTKRTLALFRCTQLILYQK